MILDSILPWELKILLGNRAYETRPLRVADVKGIQAFASLSDDEGFALLGGLFRDPKPDLRAMADAGEIGAADLVAVAAAVAAYFEALLAKNSEAIAAQIRTAMATPRA